MESHCGSRQYKMRKAVLVVIFVLRLRSSECGNAAEARTGGAKCTETLQAQWSCGGHLTRTLETSPEPGTIAVNSGLRQTNDYGAAAGEGFDSANGAAVVEILHGTVSQERDRHVLNESYDTDQPAFVAEIPDLQQSLASSVSRQLEATLLSTFVELPFDSAAKPLTLARQGFFYDGRQACCSTCNCVVDDSADYVTQHYQKSPDCPVVRGEILTIPSASVQARLAALRDRSSDAKVASALRAQLRQDAIWGTTLEELGIEVRRVGLRL